MARHSATEMITPSKKQKIFYEIQWSMRPEGSKIQARYFRQACIRKVGASGMELLEHFLYIKNVCQLVLMKIAWLRFLSKNVERLYRAIAAVFEMVPSTPHL